MLRIYMVRWLDARDCPKTENVVANDASEAVLLLKAHRGEAICKITDIGESIRVDIGRTQL